MSSNVLRILAKPLQKRADNAIKTMASAPIPWTDAKKMIKSYWQNSKSIKVPVEVGATGVFEEKRLDGLRISRTDIQAIFDNDNGVDEIFIMLGVRLSDIDETDDDDQYFTTLLAGLKANNIVSTKVIDFCDPCPNKCPANYASLVTAP